MTQCQMILQYMDDFGSITPLDALREFGCMRLAARISDIKRMGIEIISEKEHAKNRYNRTVSYSRYKKVST